MTNHFVVSDQHFNHARILTFKDEAGNLFRGDLFKDVDHMNETMVDNHNRLVMPNDHVWFLGDVFFGSVDDADKILSRMNGKKRLTPGNHDYLSKHKEFYHKHFEKIEVWNMPEHRVKGNRIVMTHVPIHETSFGKASINVHGHTHQQKNITPVHINVSVEKTNYTPVPLDEVLDFQGIHR